MLITSLLLISALHSIAALPVPTKVSNLRVEHRTRSTITLKWKDQPVADRYQIRVTRRNGTLVRKQFTKKRTLEITSLKADTRYNFKVRAQRREGEHKIFGPYSKTVQARTKPLTPVFIGFWGLNGYLSESGLTAVQNRFHSTVFQVASAASNYTVNSLLPLVRATGMKVTLRMTHDHGTYTTNGNFDLAKWKTDLDAWDRYDIQSYINDGTLVGHMLLDDIDTFRGTDPTAADLEEMAKYSQEKFPGLMTFVRQKCSGMPTPVAGQYQYVDNCVNQYTNYQGYSDGPITDYITTQTTAATQLGLGMINGLNIADGGDGSSGQPGWSDNHYAMSADEITEYGEALLAVPNIQLFLMWEYDGDAAWSDGTIGDDYFNQLELQTALANLGTLAAE